MCELDNTIKTFMEKDKKESISIDKKRILVAVAQMI